MRKLPQNIISCLERQKIAIISTLDAKKRIHCSVKGIVGIEPQGKVYIIDLYCRNTFKNLKKDPTISVTVVDEARFEGYTLKGKAKIVARDKIEDHIMKGWEAKVIERISSRVIKNIQVSRKTRHHPESRMPQPRYLIAIEVKDIVDLIPSHLKPPAFKKE